MVHLGHGWRPDPHDPRDLHLEHDEVRGKLRGRGVVSASRARRKLPAGVDLRRWCSPVQFQGSYNTCNVHAICGLLEYLENRAFDKSIVASRLFLFRAAQNLLGECNNDGVYLRQVMGALKLIGVPPEKFWPYPPAGTIKAPLPEIDPKTLELVDPDPHFFAEPTAFCYALAANYEAITYYRLDAKSADGSPAIAGAELLTRVKSHLAASQPASLGFPVHRDVFQKALATGQFPYPAPNDPVQFNHAVLAVGYDDAMKIDSVQAGGPATTGALLIRNSWSAAWGEDGYGWLPYEYVLQGVTSDYWTLTSAAWTDTGQFQLPIEQGTAEGGQRMDDAQSRTAQYIAELTTAKEKLDAFNNDPDAAMEAAGIPHEHREALKSGDPEQIKQHLGDQAPPGCLVIT